MKLVSKTIGGLASNVREATTGWTDGWLELEAAGAPIVVCDRQGGIIGATPSARALLVEVTQVTALVLPNELWLALSSIPVGQATEWIPSTGRLCLGCTRYPLGEVGFFIFMREISDKQAALSRRLHRQRLESMGRLVAGIVHDLRSPLASIAYSADLLREGRDSPTEVAACSDEIRESCARLTELTSSLLDFGRSGGAAEAAFRITDSLERVARLVGPQLRTSKHVLRWKVEGDGLCAYGNRILAEQIIVNLVLNAAEASDSPCTVDIRADTSSSGEAPPRAGMIRIRVSDDGPGVPLELRQRVFEPFFTTKAQGSGLGLTIARETALQLGGELLLEEAPRGATFVLMLPCVSLTSTSGALR